MAHERNRDVSKRPFFLAERFPCVPVDVALIIGREDLIRAVFDDESDCGAANSVTEFENETFEVFGFE